MGWRFAVCGLGLLSLLCHGEKKLAFFASFCSCFNLKKNKKRGYKGGVVCFCQFKIKVGQHKTGVNQKNMQKGYFVSMWLLNLVLSEG